MGLWSILGALEIVAMNLTTWSVSVLYKLSRSDTQWPKMYLTNHKQYKKRTHYLLLNPYRPAITSLLVAVKWAINDLCTDLFVLSLELSRFWDTYWGDTPPLPWPTFYPESSYRPLLSGVVWFAQDRGCGGAAAGTLTVLALGGGLDNEFAENSCSQWFFFWGGG